MSFVGLILLHDVFSIVDRKVLFYQPEVFRIIILGIHYSRGCFSCEQIAILYS